MAAARLIAQAFDKLSLSEPAYSDLWLCDETWIRALKSRYPDISKLATFDAVSFNRALLAKYGTVYEKYGDENLYGVFSKKFKTVCPYDDSKRRTVRFYYLNATWSMATSTRNSRNTGSSTRPSTSLSLSRAVNDGFK
jgi:hypothetical protein